MFTYKLCELFPNGEKFRVEYTDKETGKIVSNIIRFEPGTTYQSDDKVLKKSLMQLRGKYPKSVYNKNFLEGLGLTLQEELCKSCGGKVVKYVVNYFDIIEE